LVVRGGDIKQLTIGGREFEVQLEAKVKIKLGGMTTDVTIAGNGVATGIGKRLMAGFTDCPILIDDTRQDLEYLQAKQSAGDPLVANITLASGKTYSGSLWISGELEKDTGEGVCTLEMKGGKFEQI
jgi:hypothetical protein